MYIENKEKDELSIQIIINIIWILISSAKVFRYQYNLAPGWDGSITVPCLCAQIAIQMIKQVWNDKTGF